MCRAIGRGAGPILLMLAAVWSVQACGGPRQNDRPSSPRPSVRPSILLITLDTTRADAIGPEATGIDTPGFNALAAKGTRFRQAYATVPETLPSHTAMLTGLYPAGNSIHENGRFLPPAFPVVAERLKAAGYHTAAFVSSFILSRQFGLSRGFDVYDDELPKGAEERRDSVTTDRAISFMQGARDDPLFLWVHYFGPHYPYEPPEPYRKRFAAAPYLGEVAAMDEQLARLVNAFEARTGTPQAVIAAGDHGEGLGEHGEARHGDLLYQSTMRVPMVIVGPGIRVGVSDEAVSTRRVFNTVLDLAGVDSAGTLRSASHEIVLGEAMKPYLNYGWQPQIMAVDLPHKFILAGRLESYDVVADPRETRNLQTGRAGEPAPPPAIRDYPVPSTASARGPDRLDADTLRALASLGYVSPGSAPIVRKDAPRPSEMTGLFDLLERASGLFVQERYALAIPLFERVLAADTHNLDATLRLATAHSMLGHGERALEWFRKAAALAPDSPDVRTYLALHYARGPGWERAIPMLEQSLAESPERIPVLEALALLRERQGRAAEAIALLKRLFALRAPGGADLVRLGRLAMSAGDNALALESFEMSRRGSGAAFDADLELGAVYLSARRFEDAKAALDRVPRSHPEYAMALFKRAQVSVLLNEPDRAARIEEAKRFSNATTRELIAKERLFQNVRVP